MQQTVKRTIFQLFTRPMQFAASPGSHNFVDTAFHSLSALPAQFTPVKTVTPLALLATQPRPAG